MKMMLIHPPLDDPTLPYHSTAYLKGHLAHRGFRDVVLRDVNVEYVNYLLQPRSILAHYEEADRRMRDFRSTGPLDYEQQHQYYGFLETRRTNPEEIQAAAEGLRKRDSFLNFRSYLKNINVIKDYLSVLGALSYPCEFEDFSPMTKARYSNGSLKDILDPRLADKVCAPFAGYFQEHIANDPAFAGTDLFGISIVYDHQIVHALHFARLLKQRWPAKQVVFGGTAITQLFKYLKDRSRIKELFTLCDAITVGEGETAVCDLAACDGDLQRGNIANTIIYREDKKEVVFPAIRYENLTEIGGPEYDHPWDLYLSPERGINYSPTRGCYWNRCTFCDYGLNTDKPTSPWRERKIDQVMEDLSRAYRDFGVRYVYFAVDVMAPGYLERLSDALYDARLDIRWSAELRMERIFSEERVRKMKKAGCVCVSFGMESGNQRILDLIDKGTKIQYMSATMKNFAQAGVACQLMAFTDFPKETPEEKEETRRFIRENEPYWSAGGLGTFLLTGTSIIAKNPEKFGITLIETKGADITRGVAYRVDNETGQRRALTEEGDASFDRSGDAFPPVLGRPWAGGTDSLHSMVYYGHHGMEFFKRNPPKPEVFTCDVTDEVFGQCSLVIEGKLVSSSYDLTIILANRKRFFAYVDEMVKRPEEPTYAAFCEWAASIPVIKLAADGAQTCWVITKTLCVRVDKFIVELLTKAVPRGTSVDEILSGMAEPVREKVFKYLRGLEAKGVLLLRLNDKLMRSVASAEEDDRRMSSVRKTTAPWRIETPPVPKNDTLVTIT